MNYDDDIMKLTNLIRETAFAIHNYHKSAHFEKIYEASLVNRLRKHNIHIEQQPYVEVRDEDGSFLGFYRPDLLIEGKIICELKVAKTIIDEHIAQALGYLRGTQLRHAIIINFGAARLQIKKLVL